MAKKYTLQQISAKAENLTACQQKAAKGGYKTIPTTGAGSIGFVTWEGVDIRNPFQDAQAERHVLSTKKPLLG